MAGSEHPFIRPLVYRGAREISAVVGINWKEFGLYVEKYDLPAFKIGGRGTWLATPTDLENWIEDQCKKWRR